MIANHQSENNVSNLQAFGITYRCACSRSFHSTVRMDPDDVWNRAAMCGCGLEILPKEWTEIEPISNEG